jgi:hypothetical protein
LNQEQYFQIIREFEEIKKKEHRLPVKEGNANDIKVIRDIIHENNSICTLIERLEGVKNDIVETVEKDIKNYTEYVTMKNKENELKKKIERNNDEIKSIIIPEVSNVKETTRNSIIGLVVWSFVAYYSGLSVKADVLVAKLGLKFAGFLFALWPLVFIPISLWKGLKRKRLLLHMEELKSECTRLNSELEEELSKQQLYTQSKINEYVNENLDNKYIGIGNNHTGRVQDMLELISNNNKIIEGLLPYEAIQFIYRLDIFYGTSSDRSARSYNLEYARIIDKFSKSGNSYDSWINTLRLDLDMANARMTKLQKEREYESARQESEERERDRQSREDFQRTLEREHAEDERRAREKAEKMRLKIEKERLEVEKQKAKDIEKIKENLKDEVNRAGGYWH